MDDPRAACRSLVGFGSWAGWGLVVVGLLSGALDLAEAVDEGLSGPAGWARAGLRVAIEVTEFVLAGWGVRALTRITSAWVLEYLERVRPCFGPSCDSRCSGTGSAGTIAESLEATVGVGSFESCAGTRSGPVDGRDRPGRQGRGLGRSRDEIE